MMGRWVLIFRCFDCPNHRFNAHTWRRRCDLENKQIELEKLVHDFPSWCPLSKKEVGKCLLNARYVLMWYFTGKGITNARIAEQK